MVHKNAAAKTPRKRQAPAPAPVQVTRVSPVVMAAARDIMGPGQALQIVSETEIIIVNAPHGNQRQAR